MVASCGNCTQILWKEPLKHHQDQDAAGMQTRGPRANIIQMYSMSIDDILRAFQDWQEHLTPADPLRIKQTTKMNAVLTQCVRV